MTPTHNNETSPIDSFSGEYRFLSNFFLVEVAMDGVVYPSTEHAFQAAKTTSQDMRKMFLEGTCGQAKARGRGLSLRPDWESIKIDIMRGLLMQKFNPSTQPQLSSMLIATHPRQLIEGNHWNDRFWGVCNGVGENHLGKLLMDIRESMVDKRSS